MKMGKSFDVSVGSKKQGDSAAVLLTFNSDGEAAANEVAATINKNKGALLQCEGMTAFVVQSKRTPIEEKAEAQAEDHAVAVAAVVEKKAG